MTATADRSDILLARVAGVLSMAVLAALVVYGVWNNANPSVATLAALGIVLLFTGGLVALAVGKAGSPGRAFGLAVVLSLVGVFALGALLFAGAFVVCLYSIGRH